MKNDDRILGPELPPEDERAEQLIKAMLYATWALPFVLGAIILLVINIQTL